MSANSGSNENLHEVEAIIGYRKIRGKVMYSNVFNGKQIYPAMKK